MQTRLLWPVPPDLGPRRLPESLLACVSNGTPASEVVLGERTQRQVRLGAIFHLALLLAGEASLPETAGRNVLYPWPGPDAFRIWAGRRELLESLLTCDLLMFPDARFPAWLRRMREEFGADVRQAGAISTIKGDPGRLRPIGIGFQTWAERAQSPPGHFPAPWMSRNLHVFQPGVRIRPAWTGSIIRRACSKRLWAIDAFFQQFPQYRGRFTFIQIAVPTRGDLGPIDSTGVDP